MMKRTLIFLLFNFIALGLGSWMMADGPNSIWYEELSKAPWTPPGWMFGTAWSLIMISFAFYMAKLWEVMDSKKRITVEYIVQWGLNVSWNPIFFYFHYTYTGLLILFHLTMLITFIFFKYRKKLNISSLLILPYVIWLFLATSLNLYIILNNT